MKLARRLFVIFCLALLGTALFGAVYARKYGFSQSWRQRIEEEVAKRGYFIDIGKLTLGPLRGLVAEDIVFFQTKKKEQEIATVDDVYLDLDFSQVLNQKQLSINTLDIQDANLSLPLEPGNPDSTDKLRIKKMSGRLVVTESQIEVVRTYAEIEGIEISVKGTLYRPENESGLFAGKKQTSQERQDELRKMTSRRLQTKEVLRVLKRVEYLSDEKATLEIEFRSDLADLQGLRASARFSAKDFQRGPYIVNEFALSIEYDGEQNRAVVEELKIVDQKGDLTLSGEWKQETNEISFGLNSTADFPAILAQFVKIPEMDEIVFFSPPKIQASGKIRLNEFQQDDRPDFWIPAQFLGNFRCDRFVSKGGTVFNAMEFDFSGSGNRFFVRNARLSHKTGIAQANLMFDSSGGDRSFRYQSEIKLDPRTFAPFFSDEGTRSFLESWEFNKDSTVYIAAVGEGPTLDSNTWTSKGVVDFRNFKLHGLKFDELEANYELNGYLQTYRDIRLVSAEGALESEEIVYNAEAKTWDFPAILSKMKVIEGGQEE